MQEEERLLAVGGVTARKMGCSLTPIFKVKSAGYLKVTDKRILFEPWLFYKWTTRRVELNLGEVLGAESSGGPIELTLTNFITIGKALTIRLKSGKSLVFRSQQADELADAINFVVLRTQA